MSWNECAWRVSNRNNCAPPTSYPTINPIIDTVTRTNAKVYSANGRQLPPQKTRLTLVAGGEPMT